VQSPWKPPETQPVGREQVRVFCPEGVVRWRIAPTD
jgi:dihydroorotase